MKRVTILFVLGLLLLTSIQRPASAQEASAVKIFATLKRSLAIVGNSDGVGTAFCISSNSTSSFFLTNAHVVGADAKVTVVLEFPTFRVLRGTVIARGFQQDPDLAIIQVPVGSIPILRLRTAITKEGERIAIAGYPSAQYDFARLSGRTLPSASIHVGTISAVANRGRLVEFDAQSLPGNSGGPIFDLQDGAVVGVVAWKLKRSVEANIAIGSPTFIPFLTQNKVSISTADTTADPLDTAAQPGAANVLPTLPGAGVVAIIYDDSTATGDGVGPAIAASAADLGSKLSKRFNVQTTIVRATLGSPKVLGDVAREHGALIAVPFYGNVRVKQDMSNQYGRSIKWSFGLSSALIDIYGTTWFSAKKEKDSLSARVNYSAISSSFADLNDQLVDALGENVAATSLDASGVANFFRYALPMPNGDRRLFVGLRAVPNGAQANVAPFSPAASAGLQTGDVVLEFNGVSTKEKTDAQLLDLLRSAKQTGLADFLIQSPDGKPQHIKTELKDIRWYLERRKALGNSP